MTAPKESLEQIANVETSLDKTTLLCQIATMKRIAAEALASLQGEDAVERVARIIDPEAYSTNYMSRDEDWQPDDDKPKQMRARDKARAILATGLVPDEAAIRAEPTLAQINSACLSFRHDFGLLDATERGELQWQATEWLRAWQKEGFGCDRDEVIERCAAVVDQCNREGPYEAIASAKRIRALKSAAIRSGGAK